MRFTGQVLYIILVAALFSISVFAQDDTIRVETDLVTVNVAVADKDSRFVKGLKQEQFEVFDNGTKQPIAYFSGEKSPVAYGIVYDMHPTTTERTGAILDSLRVFTKNLPEEDRFFLTAFNQTGSLNLDFIPTVEQIEKNLSFNSKTREPNSLYDAIYAAANKISESKIQKKTIIIVSDGADHNSRHSFSDLSKQLKTLDIQIYAVIFDDREMWAYSDLTRGDETGKKNSSDATSLDRAAIQELTLKSGGVSRYPAVGNALELYKIYNQIAAEMREFYTISFYPAEKDGKWHELRIGLRAVEGSKRFSLTYRQGYQSPLPSR